MLLTTDTRMHPARLITAVATQLRARLTARIMARSRAHRTDPRVHLTAHTAVLLAVHLRSMEVSRRARTEASREAHTEESQVVRAAARPTRSSRSHRPRLRPTTRKSPTCLLSSPADQTSTSTVFFFGTVSSTIETTSYITLEPARSTDGALYEEVGAEDESYGGGEKPWGRYRRAEWCGDKPCRLAQYTDDVIAEACKQYGAEGGYPVGKVTTVTEYGPATETVTPTTCDATGYPESTEKSKGGYGGHEEGGHEQGGFEWPSKSTDSAYGSKPEETAYSGEEHGHGKPSGFEGHGKPSGFEGHGKPTGFGSGEYGSESTSTEESWAAKPTGFGGKPSFGAYSAEEPSSTEKAWGSEPSASGYGGEDHGHGEHGKPSFGGYGHEEPTSSEASWSAESTPTGYGGEEQGHGKPSDGGWGHKAPTATESAWGAESTSASYGGEEHGHGKPSGEWGVKPSGYPQPSGYGGEEHGGKPEHGEHGGKGYVEPYLDGDADANHDNSGKPKMCKVKHPKVKA
jgi:hypothetical protein